MRWDRGSLERGGLRLGNRLNDTSGSGPFLTDDGRYRLLVEAISDYAIYMLDPEGRIVNWNTGAQRFKGYSAGEIVGQNFSRFYTEEDRSAGIPQRNLKLAAQEGRYESEGWRVRKDGTRFWAHVIIDRILEPGGTLIGFAKITRDLTERRNAQLELERTREALFQAQKMEAVGQLTGGVAHDFNNLLMAILGSLEIVKKRMTPDARITPFLDNAVQGAQRGAALTQRMLAFARRQELSVQPVDLVALVRGMTDLLERSLGPSMFVSTRFPLSLPHVRSDPSQLESALLNLCVNARDAMPQGGPITISAVERTIGERDPVEVQPGAYVVLSVVDEGEGMDEATLARATEPFFTTKGVGKGTGLGLSMVHGLAEQSGGKLLLRSRPGQGTTAELWLPVAEDHHARATGDAETGAAERPGGAVVLAVDDDVLVLMNTVAMLEDLGHRVIEARSARRALDVLEREKVDLIVTDHAMPQMTGVELADIVRSKFPDLPVLLATGYADVPASKAGPLPVLAKPFMQSDLEAAVTRLLGEARPQASGGTMH
jgi:PAS domain S-box-containing protein